MMRPTASWRSYLFVPLLNQGFVEKAASRGADAIILDCEDSIPPDRKVEARNALSTVAKSLAEQRCDVVVRINRPWPEGLPDLQAAIGPNVRAILAPKVPNAGHVLALCEIMEEVERCTGVEPGSTGLIAMIETAVGIGEMRAIASAHPRVAGIVVGAEDLATDLGAKPESALLHYPNVMAVIAAREAGCAPIGYVGSVANFTDLDAFAETIQAARAMGFVGGFAIHPNQVPVLNAGFSPDASEVAEARHIVSAFEQGLANGSGAVQVDGRMIDKPVADRARALLAARR